MVGLTLVLSFWAISWIVRALQTSLAQQPAAGATQPYACSRTCRKARCWLLAILQPLQQELAGQRQQTLHWPAADVAPAQGEPVLLRNLLENASRYSPPGSQITVMLEADDDAVFLSVMDEGPGIEPDAAEELTKAFRRRDRRYGGSGLGLNIVLRILQMHYGELNLINRSGLIARCMLPLRLN
ncbi:Sensor protein BasS|nr:Sensor protein BasS [Candidatus Pantoea persica]